MKRALDHLHKSQAGLEAVAPKKVLPESMVAEARKELFEIREGILRLMDEFSYKQEELATVVGKSRSHIANLLRLLTLPEDIRQLLDEGNLGAVGRGLRSTQGAAGVPAAAVAGQTRPVAEGPDRGAGGKRERGADAGSLEA